MKNLLAITLIALGSTAAQAQEAFTAPLNNCVPVTAGQPIAFQATGVSLNSINLAFGRMPYGQSIGQVTFPGSIEFAGQTFTGSSSATGSNVTVSLVKGQDGSSASQIAGMLTLSQHELQLAGVGMKDDEAVCVSGIGFSGSLYGSLGVIYGGYVYVYFNGGSQFIRFRI